MNDLGLQAVAAWFGVAALTFATARVVESIINWWNR